MSVILYDLLIHCRDTCRNLTFDVKSGDTCRAITSDAIVVRKCNTAQRENDQWHANETMPGIVISPAMSIQYSDTAGENNRDDIVYPILFQLIDRDESKNDNLHTYLHWQQLVAKAFHQTQRTTDPSSSLYCIINATVSQVDSVDERLWVRHRQFVGGVVVQFLSRESRG